MSSSSASEIITIPGHGDIASSFLIRNGSNSAIVDCGSPTMLERIQRCLAHFRVPKVSHIICTHTHYDHVKGLRGLVDADNDISSGARVVVHEAESGCLEEGYSRLPKGTNFGTSIVVFFGHVFLSRIYERFEAVVPDVIFPAGEEFFELEGGNGLTLMHTPGHTAGSISILLPGKKEAIIGDLIEYGGVPEEGGYPGFADDTELLGRSWRRLLEVGVEVFHCSHGVQCPRRVVIADLQRRFPDEYDIFVRGQQGEEVEEEGE